MTIASEKYVAFTTYKADGTTSSVPVWIVDVGDGTLGFTTASSSVKVKRLAKNDRVHLQPCNAKGDVKDGSARVDGTARAAGGAEFDAVRAKIKSKYGIQFGLINLIGKAAKLIGKGSGTDTAVIITLDS